MNRLGSDNYIYRRQLAVLTFFMTIAFKVVMLPKYLSMGAPRDFILGMAVAMLIESVLFIIVYQSIFYRNILDMHVNFWVIRLLLMFVIVSSGIRFLVLSVETLDYISSLLFQEGRWLFIILTLLPALGYIAYKGANIIARVSEIVVWAVILTFVFTLLFLRADVDVMHFLPLLDDGANKVIDTILKHSLWLGDYVPFIVLSVAPSRTRLDKVAPYVGLTLTYLITIGFFALFIVIYGDVAPYIKYAFSNIGIYNSISNLLGGVDFPIVCVWMLMAIVKLSFLLYSVVFSLEHIVKKEGNKRLRLVIVVLLTITYMLILSFGVSGTEDMYLFATSWVRYLVLAVDFVLIAMLIIVGIVSRAKSKKM